MYARRLPVGGGGSFVWARGSGVLAPGTIATITDDTKYNAWPSICRLANGSLLMAYVKANNHNADTSGNIVGRIATVANALLGIWGAEFTIADQANGCINVGLLTSTTGRVICEYNEFDGSIDPPDCVRVTYSDDAHLGPSATWSSPYTVDTSFTTQVAAPSSRPFQRAGMILLPVYGISTSESFWTAALLSSSDDGATFGGQVTMASGPADGRNHFEPSLCAIGDGSLIAHYRTSSGSGDMRQNVSANGTTWGATAVAFGGYSPSNVYRRVTGTLVATVRGNAAAKLQAFTSIDDAATWDDQGILDNTSYTELEYGCAIDIDTTTLLVVYSVQSTAAITNADIKTVIVTEGIA